MHTDHDYYSHKSPSEHSDSGVSLDSMGDSPRGSTDGLETVSSEGKLSELVVSQSHYGTETMFQSDASPLGLEDLDMHDINVDFSGVASANFLDNFDLLASNDKEVSVNFGMLSFIDLRCLNSVRNIPSFRYTYKMKGKVSVTIVVQI